jgi:hypothetical protein
MTLFESTEHNVTFSHVLYIWTLFLLLSSFLQEWSRILKLCIELLYKVSFNLYAVYMTRFDATLPNLSVSYDR